MATAALQTISKWANADVPAAPTVGQTRRESQSLDEPFSVQEMQVPSIVYFGATIDARLKIKKPFRVQMERTEEGIVAHAEETGDFGCGVSAGDALHDLGKTIAELYFSLTVDKDRLSADLETLRLKLDEHLTEVGRKPLG